MKAHLFLVALFFQTVLGVPDENGEASFVNWQGSGYYWSPCKFDYPRIPRYEALPVCKNNYLPVENANNGYATRAKQAEYGNGRHRCSDVPDETHYFCALPSKYTKAYWEDCGDESCSKPGYEPVGVSSRMGDGGTCFFGRKKILCAKA